MGIDDKNDLDYYYDKAAHFAKSHYENFPVISLFLEKNRRKHIAVIYQFARQADDLADEGNDSPEIKIDKLNKYEKEFNNSIDNLPVDGFWKVVKNTDK